MDRIPKVNETDVFRVIQRDFDPKYRESIIKMFSGRTDYRVQLSILKVSGGNIDRVAEQIEIAKIDYRDVISAAEYPKFNEIGFVGIRKLSKSETEKLKEDDWKQYQSWLNR